LNVALRSLHDRLQASGDAKEEWTRIAAAAAAAGGGQRRGRIDVAAITSALGVRGPAADWLRDLRTLRVLADDDVWDVQRAASVAVALELAADSFQLVETTETWAPVATLPHSLLNLLRPPAMRQTTGVLLELIDSACDEVLLASPYVDQPAVRAIASALLDARRKGVDVRVITSPGRAQGFASFATQVESCRAVKITEVRTEISPLGSHAKVLVVDRQRAYVGSANLTAAGLERNIEVGVEIKGVQVRELARLITALERLGVPAS